MAWSLLFEFALSFPDGQQLTTVWTSGSDIMGSGISSMTIKVIGHFLFIDEILAILEK